MAELGQKHECPDCGLKFYDLGKSDAVCPKCGDGSDSADEDKTPIKPTKKKKKKKVAKS